ncbi:MAG: hypothetical protein L3K15_07240 [Thermoplasmata archaeon]|nr:hypothetical protein [Thermoplasmata archaeon]
MLRRSPALLAPTVDPRPPPGQPDLSALRSALTVETLESPAICIWLSSENASLLARVTPELRRQLAHQVGEVALVHPPGARGMDRECSGCWARQLEVGAIARVASCLTRSGVPVLVAHHLADAAERSIARHELDRMLEIFLGQGENFAPPPPIATEDRTVQAGRVVDRELPRHPDDSSARPEVVVDASRVPAEGIALRLVDILTRAGWLGANDRDT